MSQTLEAEHQMLTQSIFWDHAHGQCLTFFHQLTSDDCIYYDQSEYDFPLPDFKYWMKERWSRLPFSRKTVNLGIS